MADDSLLGASIRGDEEAVRKCLCRQDVNVNESFADWGGTPLMCAAQNNYHRVCRLLLARGADYSVLDTFGRTCLHRAAQSGNVEVVDELLHYAPVDLRDVSGQTALHIAAEAGSFDVVGTLLRSGADFLAKDPNGNTALSLAFKRHHQEVCELLEMFIQHRVFRLPPELQPYPHEILAAYRHAMFQGRKRLFRQRLVLIGDVDTGKCQLLTSLIGADKAPQNKLMSGRPYYMDRKVYYNKKKKFAAWGDNCCGLHQATLHLCQQHDVEVARLLLSDILRSPLGCVASHRLANNQMQKLVDQLVREVRSTRFESVLGESNSADSRAEGPIRQASVPPGEDSARLLDVISDTIIQEIIIMWRKVLSHGVGVLVDKEPEVTEIHVSKIGGSRQLWNIVAPFLSPTAIYLSTFNLDDKTFKRSFSPPASATASPAQSPPGSPLQSSFEEVCQQEEVLKSQLMTAIAQQPPHSYTHRAYDGQEQPMPAYIVCNVRNTDTTSSVRSIPTGQLIHPLMTRLRSSWPGPHEVDARHGGMTMVFEDMGAPPPPGCEDFWPRNIRIFRRILDETIRTVHMQQGSNSMVPLSWLKLEDSFHDLRATGRYFITVENDCLQEARRTTSNVINDVFSLSSALGYFHNMGWIAYFPQVPKLANVVFTDPEFLINLLADVLGISDTALPERLRGSALKLYATGLMEPLLQDHYQKYLQEYSRVADGSLLLEDLDLAVKLNLNGQAALCIPAACRNAADFDIVQPDGNPPRLHVRFPDDVPVYGYLQRLLVHVMQYWQLESVMLASNGGQFWLENGHWQMLVAENANGIAISVLDPMLAIKARRDSQATEVELDGLVELGSSAETVTSQSLPVLGQYEDGDAQIRPPCTSVELADYCQRVFRFLLESTMAIKDCWYPGLSVRLCFRAADVGYTDAADGAAPLPDCFVGYRQCFAKDLTHTWCWLSALSQLDL